MSLRNTLNTVEKSHKEDPVFMWEMQEDEFQKLVIRKLSEALMAAGVWRGLEAEPLVEPMFMGEKHPAVVEHAIMNARDRLAACDALTDELRDAVEHALNFSQHRQELLQQRREEIKGTVLESADRLCQLFTAGRAG